MLKIFCILLLLSFCTGNAIAQGQDTASGGRKIALDEFVFNDKGQRIFRHTPRTQTVFWHFLPGSEKHLRYTDSTYYLTPVPALSERPARLRNVTLKLRA